MPVEMVVQNILEVLVVGAVFIGLAYSPLPRAWAHRIMHGKEPHNADDPRVDDLMEENAMMRRQLEEMHGRIEFTERLLAKGQGRE